MAGDYSDEHITPKEKVKELIVHSPEIHEFYNASDDLIKIHKLTSDGDIYERQITSPKITDYTESYIIIYSAWGHVRG